MIEQILTRKNMLRAMYRVQKNHGSAGVDPMPVTKLSEFMSIDKEELSAKVRSGSYLPQAILGVEIPKGGSKMRLLGIPTVTDRLLQQAVLQIITARFEFEFSENSFGFRPNKSLHQAVMKAQGCINEGFQNIVDIDLKTFFDEVDHRHLMQLLYRKIKCPETLRLIRKWLRIPILINGKLNLPINREKSSICRPVNFTILGFGFVPTYVKGEKGKYQLVVSDKSWNKFKQKLKTLTRKTTPMSFDERIRKLKEVQRGWVNNYRMASISSKLSELDGWLRNRLRYCIWHYYHA